MKRFNIKFVIIVILSVCLLSVNVYAHSGRTDANGGHRDNKNKSGLGSYHYYCGGYPAHLHPNGVCPYSDTSSKSTTSSSVSSSKAPEAKLVSVEVSSIKINRILDSIEEGKSEILTTIITPENATDKSVTWKSSDESVLTITSSGVITAIKPGIATITVSTNNGKSSTKQIIVKEKIKEENNNVVKTSINERNITNTYSSNNKQDDSNILGGILAVGILGGGGYYGYKKYKEKF